MDEDWQSIVRQGAEDVESQEVQVTATWRLPVIKDSKYEMGGFARFCNLPRKGFWSGELNGPQLNICLRVPDAFVWSHRGISQSVHGLELGSWPEIR